MRRHPIPSLLFALAVGGLASGCGVMRVARSPMTVVTHEAAATSLAPPSRAIILLPGMGDRPGAFERNGFVRAIQEAAPSAVVIAPDAHFGYYRNRTAIDRLYEDALLPALATGAEEVWVVGMSMGGTGALGLAMNHPDQVDRVFLLGPYLGGPGLAAEVATAGGLELWDRHEVDGEDERAAFFRSLWAWLDEYTVAGSDLPELHIAIGEDDRGVAATNLVGAVLPDGSYVTSPGGHDWRTWGPLFEMFVAEYLGPDGSGT